MTPETRRRCGLCNEEAAVRHTKLEGLDDTWTCMSCGYIGREDRAVTVEAVGTQADKVWFYRMGHKVGLKLSDNEVTTRAWMRYWLAGLVDHPSQLSWDGMHWNLPVDRYEWAYGLGLSAALKGEDDPPFGPDEPLFYEWKRGYAVGSAAPCARCGRPPQLVESRFGTWVASCSRGGHPGDDFVEDKKWTTALEGWNQRQAEFTADAAEGEG